MKTFAYKPFQSGSNNFQYLISKNRLTKPTKLSSERRLDTFKSPPLVQPKLSINQSGDRFEQEADRVANQVMCMPESPVQGRTTYSGYTMPSNEQPIVNKVLQSSGQPLNRTTREFMEQRFGHDFSKVSVCADNQAGESAAMFNARAFTVANNVVFGAGQYSPETTEGKRLIAHELAHITQQRKNSLNAQFIQFQQAPQNQPAAQNAQQTQQAQNALTTYTGTNFTGAQIQCDVDFVQRLQTIDTYAGNHNVQIHVTRSFHQQNQPITGAIVQPATNSNHDAGHAIDMNIMYHLLYNSTQLQPNNLNNLPHPVRGFINDIQNDANLRWGGDFATSDPVHIDDGLNINNLNLFQQRVAAVQAANAAATQAAP